MSFPEHYPDGYIPTWLLRSAVRRSRDNSSVGSSTYETRSEPDFFYSIDLPGGQPIVGSLNVYRRQLYIRSINLKGSVDDDYRETRPLPEDCRLGYESTIFQARVALIKALGYPIK